MTSCNNRVEHILIAICLLFSFASFSAFYPTRIDGTRALYFKKQTLSQFEGEVCGLLSQTFQTYDVFCTTSSKIPSEHALGSPQTSLFNSSQSKELAFFFLILYPILSENGNSRMSEVNELPQMCVPHGASTATRTLMIGIYSPKKCTGLSERWLASKHKCRI